MSPDAGAPAAGAEAVAVGVPGVLRGVAGAEAEGETGVFGVSRGAAVLGRGAVVFAGVDGEVAFRVLAEGAGVLDAATVGVLCPSAFQL
ncbi:hypothetical protein ACWCXL_40680 [Streptomyces sp. NPDC001588]